MKKYAAIITILLFFSLAGLGLHHVIAQTEATDVMTFTAPPEGTTSVGGIAAIEEKEVEYQLPYPGILPDHPLYFLKRFRDFVLETLIADPLRKAEFYILQGDKRLAMGMMMSAAGKASEGESVISKGEKYMEKAYQYLINQKNAGVAIPAYITEKIGNALAKHQEVISSLLLNANEQEKAGLTGSLDMVKQLMGETVKLK